METLADAIKKRSISDNNKLADILTKVIDWHRFLVSLTPREEQVLRMRFGIGETSGHTLKEVGQKFAVSRERIRQIEMKALRKLSLRLLFTGGNAELLKDLLVRL